MRHFASRVLLLTLVLGWAAAVHAISGNTGSPVQGCGKLCPATKVNITLTVAPPAVASAINNTTPFELSYTVTNVSELPVTGYVSVMLGEQVLPYATASQGLVTLKPQQVVSGNVQVTSPPAGTDILLGHFWSKLTCPPDIVPGFGTPPVACSGGFDYGSASITLVIAQNDQDHDGIPDDVERNLLATYTPLMLYSRDNGQQEQYAPIDVVQYVQESSLVSDEASMSNIPNSVLATNPLAILNPGLQGGTIWSTQALSPLPRKLLLRPSSAAKSGAPWAEILPSRSVGMYGHVTQIKPSQINDPAVGSELMAEYGDVPMYKVEYWQFYGYSHDFQLPSWAIPGVVFGYPLACTVFALACVVWPAVASQAGDVYAEADHDGDWCGLQLFIDPRVVNPVRGWDFPTSGILAVYFYAHGQKMGFSQPGFTYAAPKAVPVPATTPATTPPWRIIEYAGPNSVHTSFTIDSHIDWAQNNALQLAAADANGPYIHPVVYVEWGGHEFWPTSRWSKKMAGKHGGDGYQFLAATPPNVGELMNPMEGDAATLITFFSGYWGFYGGFAGLNGPPQGPPLHKQWQWVPGVPPDPAAYRPVKPLPY
jgi:hypothetical protein